MVLGNKGKGNDFPSGIANSGHTMGHCRCGKPELSAKLLIFIDIFYSVLSAGMVSYVLSLWHSPSEAIGSRPK